MAGASAFCVQEYHMPIYIRCSRCGKRIPAGTKCTCRTYRHREYDMYRDSRSKRFYDSEEWRRTKQRVLDLDGMDVYEYMTTGRIIAPDTVHHVIPLRDDWSLRCDPSNLMSLAASTHSRIEQEYRRDKQKMIKKLSAMLKKFRDLNTQGGI
jgi:5-methylcytosine-specific restriction endonuclease McrA